MIKLLLAAATCIGRIDRPFLASGVGQIGPITLDHYHMVHNKDILSHEAHRHPYIELLGVLYMMKLRFGKNFGDGAGSTWRLLFVYALFPWLHQYRVKARPELLRNATTRLAEMGHPSAMKLDFLSLRHIVDSVLDDDGDADGSGLEVADPLVAANKDEHSALKQAAAAEPQEAALAPLSGTTASSAVRNDASASGYANTIMMLEEENARLRNELEAKHVAE
jgi:hypothetical protein